MGSEMCIRDSIQRGRDHGLPDFNTMRESIGLDRIEDFSELTSNEELAQLFEDVYGSPDNADPWIAMISEDHVPGTMAGETNYHIMADQFTRLRDGDRFYFENALDADLAAEIKATRLSDIIERNTDLEVQDEVFWTRDTLVFRNGLDNEWLIRDFGDNGGAEVVFFGEPGIRDPNNREETAPVQRDEPINAVIVAGINELGDGFFIPNALVSSPLATRELTSSSSLPISISSKGTAWEAMTAGSSKVKSHPSLLPAMKATISWKQKRTFEGQR